MKQLILILTVALGLRLYGINWDNGFHLHPDERMLMIVAERIKFFSNLDPDFFNYGSLPIYLLKATGDLTDLIFGTSLSNYNGLLYIGRALSIIADLLTTFLIYKITSLLFRKFLDKNQAKAAGLLASLFYAITFFPIQNSHFFIVDNFLNLFSTLLFYLLLKLLEKRKVSTKDLILLALVSAAIITSKVSGIIFVGIAQFTIFYKILKTIKKGKKTHLTAYLVKIIPPLITFNFAFLTFSFLFMPFAFLRWQKFLTDILLQIKMNSNPYIFPYTLQYVGTLPYLYYLKNIFFWGAGPVLSLLALAGLILLLENFKNLKKQPALVLFFLYYGLYFLILGKSAVKFMRYMLPLYPALALFAGYAMQSFRHHLKKSQPGIKYLWLAFILLHIIYLLPFLSIYSKPNTRVQATEWILKNVPAGAKLAIEHWDDRLPLYGEEKYKFILLELYNQPDDIYKWKTIQEQLAQADYIIIASNRLYAPIQRLADCQKYKVCYPLASKYYKNLFQLERVFTDYQILKFKKVAEFTTYPSLKIPFTSFKITLNDQQADESFTVYDHPKVMIFKRI